MREEFGGFLPEIELLISAESDGVVGAEVQLLLQQGLPVWMFQSNRELMTANLEYKYLEWSFYASLSCRGWSKIKELCILDVYLDHSDLTGSQGVGMIHESDPDHLVDVLDKTDLSNLLDLFTQRFHEVIINHVLNIEGHHILKLETAWKRIK